jgi:uncharacterized protein
MPSKSAFVKYMTSPLPTAGIARCFTYGGSRDRAIFDPTVPPVVDITQEQYAQHKNAPRYKYAQHKNAQKCKLKMKSNMCTHHSIRVLVGLYDFLASAV